MSRGADKVIKDYTTGKKVHFNHNEAVFRFQNSLFTFKEQEELHAKNFEDYRSKYSEEGKKGLSGR